MNEYNVIMIGDGDELPFPPLRKVQHEIPYIDELDPPRPKRLYKIPDEYKTIWNDLHDKHVAAGFWIPATSKNADPMMPVIKKDGKLWPTVDLRERNKNMHLRPMPPRDPDNIHQVLACNHFKLMPMLKYPSNNSQSLQKMSGKLPSIHLMEFI